MIVTVQCVLLITARLRVSDDTLFAMRASIFSYLFERSLFSLLKTANLWRLTLSCRPWVRCDRLLRVTSHAGMVGKLLAVKKRGELFVVRVESVNIHYGASAMYSRINGQSYRMKKRTVAYDGNVSIATLQPDLTKKRRGPRPSLGSWSMFLELLSEDDMVLVQQHL